MPEVDTQPGIDAQLDDEHVYEGVPAQWGPVENVLVSPGRRMIADLQQSWALQSV